MASFRKRRSGRWQAQIRKSGYPTQTKSFSSKAAAAQWIRSTEYEMDQGLFMSRNEAESTTVAELLDRYLQDYTKHKRGAGPETCRIQTLLRHPLAKCFIGSVRGIDITRYRDERLEQVSPGSIRRELNYLRNICGVPKLRAAMICSASLTSKPCSNWLLSYP